MFILFYFIYLSISNILYYLNFLIIIMLIIFVKDNFTKIPYSDDGSICSLDSVASLQYSKTSKTWALIEINQSLI